MTPPVGASVGAPLGATLLLGITAKSIAPKGRSYRDFWRLAAICILAA